MLISIAFPGLNRGHLNNYRIRGIMYPLSYFELLYTPSSQSCLSGSGLFGLKLPVQTLYYFLIFA